MFCYEVRETKQCMYCKVYVRTVSIHLTKIKQNTMKTEDKHNKFTQSCSPKGYLIIIPLGTVSQRCKILWNDYAGV